MSSHHAQDHTSNVYLAVTISPNSPLYQNPDQLASHPALTYVGQVGELRDIQLLSTPRSGWSTMQEDVISALNGLNGVRRVDVQEPRTRAKRDVSDL
ncbi:hypothetical protein BDW22DRAFT_1353787 [Trametopsis cervina]|nr:hypothetical protein BDW22DRAFT_1353787 [Trametopsis cervina]